MWGWGPYGVCCPIVRDMGLGSGGGGIWGRRGGGGGFILTPPHIPPPIYPRSEPPCPDLGCAADRPYSRLLPSVTHCGFLYKTPSMAKALSERKGQEGMGGGPQKWGGGGLRGTPPTPPYVGAGGEGCGVVRSGGYGPPHPPFFLGLWGAGRCAGTIGGRGGLWGGVGDPGGWGARGGVWVALNGHGWVLVALGGLGGAQGVMGGLGWPQMVMGGYWWHWVALGGHGWPWVALGGHGWPWGAMGGLG